MARFNKAKNFAGKSYVISSDMESLINSLKASTAEDYVLEFGGFDASGDAVISKEINLSAWFEKIKGDISGEAVGIEAGNGINTKVRTIADGKSMTTIRSVGSEIVELTKAETATAGYAATYNFTVVTGYEEDGTPTTATTKIDIVKDQFLKSATVVWSTEENLTEAGAIVGESDKKTETAIYPFLKMEMYSNTNGTNEDDALATTVYIPISEMFKDYKAGKAIEIDVDTINVLIDEKPSIYTSKGV
jgi:hypothetical protein